MGILQKIKEESIKPLKTDNSKPHFTIIVTPSCFTVPEGWGFVLKQPFEGVSYIATVLFNAGFPVKIADARFQKDPVSFSLDSVGDASVIGIATYEDSFPFVQDACAQIKKKYPDKLIVLGGALVTSTPQVLMKNTAADIAVLGEGEETTRELMEAVSARDIDAIGKIPGLCYKDKSGNLHFTEKRPQMADLESLPVMNLSLWPETQKNRKVKEIFFSHSRGCYKNCSFCFRTTPQLSQKSIPKFRDELRELKKKYDFEFIYFVDLTFAIQKQRTLEICEVLKEFKVSWSCMSRVQNIDEEILKAMKAAGCQIILYGFESLDQTILDNAHKGITPAEIRRMVKLTQDNGIQVGGLFIVGLPQETRESLKKVVDFIDETGSACRVKYLSAIPGTEIYRWALETGIIKDEVSHLRWLANEKCDKDDDFINFTQLPAQVIRDTYKAINSKYIKGPRCENEWF
jgi:anaerobic magnesium-protoporphyrin IX monomethyl ester cyclase